MLRVLHVVGSLARGGIEAWLMNVLRNIGQDELKMDFLVHASSPGAYDDEARALGAKVLSCPDAGNPLKYAGKLSRLLETHGPYDVVHSHVHHFSGYVLWLAKRAGIRGRVAHSHLDTRSLDGRTGLLRKGYLALMERLIRENATVRLACSRPAAAALYGERRTGRAGTGAVRLHYCACDMSQFQREPDRDGTRAALGLPPEAFVIGHVGRFAPQKNHAFLLDVAAALVEAEPNAVLLCVGDGPLLGSMQERARTLGIEGRVRFLGARDDVPRLMQDAMDAFVMPSFLEGLPVVALEAQMAGLPMLLSDVVTEETDILAEIISRLSLADPPQAWARRLLSLRGAKLDQAEALDRMAGTPFNLRNGIADLRQIYQASLLSGQLPSAGADLRAA